MANDAGGAGTSAAAFIAVPKIYWRRLRYGDPSINWYADWLLSLENRFICSKNWGDWFHSRAQFHSMRAFAGNELRR